MDGVGDESGDRGSRDLRSTLQPSSHFELQVGGKRFGAMRHTKEGVRGRDFK